MIKFVLIAIICVLIIYIAYKVFVYYKSRKYFFENCCDFCANLQSQIYYLKKDILAVCDEKNSYSPDFNKLLLSYKKCLGDLKTFDENLTKDIDKIAILHQDEKDKIFMFLSLLGKSSEHEQLIQIDNFKQQFLQKLDKTKDENAKYGGLSIKLGLLLAISVVVIFI